MNDKKVVTVCLLATLLVGCFPLMVHAEAYIYNETQTDESAPESVPTIDPDALTGEDAVGVAVALCIVFFGASVALIFGRKK